METQYLGPPKVEGTDDSSSEQEDEKHKVKPEKRKELTLDAKKASQFYEKYV